MNLAPKVFSRDQPCTKVDLHNAFWRNGTYATTPVVTARAIIGLNAPKYLLREGYITQETVDGVDVYHPTEAGKTWLRDGLNRYLELHPEERARMLTVSPGAVNRRPVGRAKPAPVPSAPSRIIRRSKGH